MKTKKILDGRYVVHENGSIYSTISQRFLSPGRNSRGYFTVLLYDGSVPKKPMSHLVHRLVCTSFHGEPIGDANQVNHKDGNKANNAADNLEWTTGKENARHSIEVLGKDQFGVKNSNCKITPDKLHIAHDLSISCAEAARSLNCSGAYVSQIRRGLYRTKG